MQLVFYLTTFSTPCMSYLLYLMFRCDRRCDECDGKFENFVGTKHTLCLDEEKGGEKVTSVIVAHCSTFHLFVVNIVLP